MDVHCGAHRGCSRGHRGHEPRGDRRGPTEQPLIRPDVMRARGSCFRWEGLHGQRPGAGKVQREFRGGEGASVLTNTVVLEIVKDEPGWVSWLCSVGSGRGGMGKLALLC